MPGTWTPRRCTTRIQSRTTRAVVELERASGYETTVVDREHEGAEKFLVPPVEGNVDKDRIGWTHVAVA